MVFGIPLVITVCVFIVTCKVSLKRIVIRLSAFLACVFLILNVFSPSPFGLNTTRTTWDEYNDPENFLFTTRNGFFYSQVKGIELHDINPFIIEDSDYRIEIYVGDFIINNNLVEEAYRGYDAIGINIYEDGKMVAREIIPSPMDSKSLELLSIDPLVVRTYTDDYYYEYRFELVPLDSDKYATGNYYYKINDLENREYYMYFETDIGERETER